MKFNHFWSFQTMGGLRLLQNLYALQGSCWEGAKAGRCTPCSSLEKLGSFWNLPLFCIFFCKAFPSFHHGKAFGKLIAHKEWYQETSSRTSRWKIHPEWSQEPYIWECRLGVAVSFCGSSWLPVRSLSAWSVPRRLCRHNRAKSSPFWYLCGSLFIHDNSWQLLACHGIFS